MNRPWRTRLSRPALCIAAMASLSAVAFGCGSDDAKIARAKEEGKREALNQQKTKATAAELRRLRRQVGKLSNQARGSNANGNASAGQGPAAGRTSTGGSTSCGEGLSVNSATSCSFARTVRDEYQYSGGATVIDVYSPVTKRTYTMRCSDGVPTICAGGNGAAVYIR